jgi:hypothetical protein
MDLFHCCAKAAAEEHHLIRPPHDLGEEHQQMSTFLYIFYGGAGTTIRSEAADGVLRVQPPL